MLRGPMALPALERLTAEVVACRRCPRLVAWREEVGRVKRRAYRDCDYWARPVPGFGDPGAWLLLLGLAPGAHGANRTGRMFTGDRSGDFLYAALHRAGLASQPTSVARDDGLELRGAYITAPVRCVPPDNKPSREELEGCGPFLDREIALLERVRVVLVLGAIALDAYLAHAARRGVAPPRPRPRFAHGLIIRGGLPHVVVASYHVSQQNTNTGKLTPAMLDDVLAACRREARR